jgi:hypothetical protein
MLIALNYLAMHQTQVEAYKRGARTMQQQDFEGFTDQSSSRDAAWLLSTVGGEDGWDYDWDEYEDLAIPDEWDSMEPKHVNNKRVLLNLQIRCAFLVF